MPVFKNRIFLSLGRLIFPRCDCRNWPIYTPCTKVCFIKVISAISLEELYAIFNVKASAYWDSHYTFGKESRKKAKKLTPKFVDLLVVNVILPLQFCYAKHRGVDINEQIIEVISEIKKEGNTVVSNFGKMGIAPLNAKESQALLQLYNGYCTQNKCLQCVVGTNLLR
ncbi:DUF2851 family protein [Zobellia sp. OII3]|uniref:DUF2851 family protein n=1 Tax=Zobellia sp. OII3 TaxID=2034520 RepID=UPI002937099A|nr:DUF2851 family protein [Zobellia sp. OII3]